MKTSFVLFKYQIDQDYSDFMQVLEDNSGTKFAYHKLAISEEDKDHIITSPRLGKIGNSDTSAWEIARELKERKVAKTENNNREIKSDIVPVSGEWQYTRFVSVAGSELIAVEDRFPPIGMGAQSAIRRFRMYCKKLDMDFSYENTSSNEAIKKALRAWAVNEFRFSVRPFNPHPTEKAKAFSESLELNNAKSLTGKFTAGEDGISQAEGGFIETIVEFNENNYGSISIKGRTESGYSASIKSESITGDKEKDARTSAKARVFRATIEAPEEEIVYHIGKIMIDWENKQ